jgi:hypothetical protein
MIFFVHAMLQAEFEGVVIVGPIAVSTTHGWYVVMHSALGM